MLSSRPTRVSHQSLTRRKIPAHNMENVAFSPPRSSLMLPSPAAHQQPLSHKRATPRLGSALRAASSGGPSRAEQETDVEAASSHPTPVADGDLDQPLLGVRPDSPDGSIGSASASAPSDILSDSDGPDISTKDDYKREALKLKKLAWPLILQNMLGYSLAVISVAFTGHISKDALAASVLGTSLYNITGLSIIIGLSSAMETLCGNAFGAKQYALIGVFLQRSIAVCLCATIPIAALWHNVGPLLTFLKQDSLLSVAAADFIHHLFPALVLTCVSESFRRFLLAQGSVRAPMFISLTSTLLSLPLYYTLIFTMDMGLKGAALTVCMCNAITVVSLIVYTVFIGRKKVWDKCFTGFSLKEAFSGWGQFLGLALPATLMLCVEWWLFEIVILAAGLLPNASVAVGTMGICFQVTSLAYMIPLGIAGATSTRVSNELGAGHPNKARAAARVALLGAWAVGLACIAGILFFRTNLPGIFTKDDAVIELTSKAIIPLSASLIFDGTNCILNAVIRASGRQELGAIIGLCTWWGLGLPLAFIFAFVVKLGVVGIWIGLGMTTATQAFVMGTIVFFKLDWRAESQKARDRVEAQGSASQALLAGAEGL